MVAREAHNLEVAAFESRPRYEFPKLPRCQPGVPGARPGITGQTLDVTNVYLRIYLVADVINGGPTSIMWCSNTSPVWGRRYFPGVATWVAGMRLEFWAR